MILHSALQSCVEVAVVVVQCCTVHYRQLRVVLLYWVVIVLVLPFIMLDA